VGRGRPSKFRYDVWTDAGRAKDDLFMILENVSPIAATSTQRWLQLEGWKVEIRPTAWTGIRRRPV
jgi:hypothetical protein